MTKRSTQLMPLSEIKPAIRNPKDHDIGELTTSIKRFGYVDSPVLDERTGRLVAGHGRVEALRWLLKEDPEHPPDGVEGRGAEGRVEWLIPVQRGWASKNDREAEAFIIASNRLVELGGWNEAARDALLVEMAKDGDEALAGIGFDSQDVEKILRGIEREANQADEQIPPATELYTREGDLWILGPHRLLVGDSTKAEDVARLVDGQLADAVVTDPPYAIYGSSSGIGSDIADDKMVRPFFEATGRAAFANVKKFGHVYMCTDWRSYTPLCDGVKRSGLKLANCIVWDKGGGGMGSMWSNCHEWVAFFTNTPPPKAMKSGQERGQRLVMKPNIQRFPRVSGDEREFNAQKPVALMGELVTAAADKGELVIDFFGGSGSTLIACQRIDRRCFTMELEPKHAQIIIERWKRETGLEPVKVDHRA